ncbi:MAG: DUF3040 domain-containing protein [Propionibacteriaceae bacterium]|nr:DUF3040 domain-containing protein [Propionibacteriaceae bacterium]
MALTDAERRLLDELEKTLTEQDPKLASKFTQAPRRPHPAHVVVGVLGLVLGLVALVVGMSSYWWISVIGFVIMLGCAFMVISSWSRPSAAPSAPTRSKRPHATAKGDFISRMERRWQDRQEQ